MTLLHEFISNQKRLLELELRAEEDASVDPTKITTNNKDDVSRDGGFVLRNIDVIDTSVGLYGRTVVSFGNVSSHQSVTVPSQDNATMTTNKNGGRSSTSSSNHLLQAHRLTVGDEVQILPNNGKGFQGGKKSRHIGGVVCALDDVSISVALFGEDAGSNSKQSTAAKKGKKAGSKLIDEPPHDDGDGEMLGGNPPYALIPKSNIEVHQKMIAALDDLDQYGVDHPVAGSIVMAAFEQNNPMHNTKMTRSRIESLELECNLESSKLDYSQREAVVMALHSNSPIYLIHGPPGTGKTTTVAELIRCAVHYKGWKVLVTAPSNVAVDNVLERVMSIENEDIGTKRSLGTKKKIKAVRLGHPARIQRGIQQYSLESLVQSSEGTEIVKDCRAELNGYLKTLSNAKSRPNEKRLAYREMKAVRREIRNREEKVVGQILHESNVVLATNVGAAGTLLNRTFGDRKEALSFDLVIIDEAAQALEASCWISLLKGKRAVLAGDHKQLPPTIKCPARDVQNELGRTLFERLMIAYEKIDGGNRSKMLEVQYRMHQDISNWASKAMYSGKLVSHDSVKNRKLVTLPLVADTINAKVSDVKKVETDSLENVTLLLIDTAGCDMYETANEAGSRYNEGEANIVVSHLKSLLALGLRAEDIAVITPYNGQVELLRKMLLPDVPKLEIRSVDGFQGGEREAVVISLVRSSARGGMGGIGFLRDERRLNVAVTRAKRHCAVVCDSQTVTQDRFLKGLVDWMEKKGEYRSGAEYVTVMHSDGAAVRTTAIPPAKVFKQATQKDHSKKEIGKVASINSVPPSVESIPQNREMRNESTRIELMEKIKAFSDTAKKGDDLCIFPSSDYDCIVARELASQLGLECRDGESPNALVIEVLKETKRPNLIVPPVKEIHADSVTTKFAQLSVDDDESSESSYDDDDTTTPTKNDLLRQLAMERERRSSEQLISQPVQPTSAARITKKKKDQKLGRARQPSKTETLVDDLEGLDDMAFLDAQIEKVQTSHGRKIEAKGKGYRSVVNGILLASPSPRDEPKRNGAVSSALHAKLKSKEADRKLKKKAK